MVSKVPGGMEDDKQARAAEKEASDTALRGEIEELRLKIAWIYEMERLRDEGEIF